MRAWRKTPAGAMTEEQRRKDVARSYAAVYQKRGKLVPEPCEVCGEKAEKHHDDYSKPLGVRWLCPTHHRQWHNNLKLARILSGQEVVPKAPEPAPEPEPEPMSYGCANETCSEQATVKKGGQWWCADCAALS